MDYYQRKSYPAFGLYFHLVFVTKSRSRIFTDHGTEYVKSIIIERCQRNGNKILAMAIEPDHVHLLVTLKPVQSISKVIQELKGYSAYMYNRYLSNRVEELVWQRGYSVDTVSRELIPKIINYIDNQKHNREMKNGQKEEGQTHREEGQT